jgi:hypothetical protein
VVSHHLDGLSSLQVLGLLRPSTEQDSLRFQLVEPVTRRPGLSRAFPGSAFTPFEAFPSLAAVSHHCDLDPLGVRLTIAPLAILTDDMALDDPGPTDASQVRRPTPAVRMTAAAPLLESTRSWTDHRLDRRTVASARLPR